MRLTTDELEAMPVGAVVRVGLSPSASTPYKRTRVGWRRFYATTRRAFGKPSTSAAIAVLGVWGKADPD